MSIDVTVDRNLYIGGSDVPCIMEISPFKKRYDLLLEKSGLKENEFRGNEYTKYGQALEPKIRNHINDVFATEFVPNQVIKGDLRANSDGYNGSAILEIKTTSKIYEKADEYTAYLVQLLFYMFLNEVNKGVLAVYNRTDDFSLEFDPERLQVFDIELNQYTNLLNKVNVEIDRFRADLKRLKENPLLSEQDFQPNELITVANKVLAFENKLAEFKVLEEEYKKAKQELFKAMQSHDVKSWTTPNGTKITRVDGTVASVETVTEFDIDTFKQEHIKMYNKYAKTVEKKKNGRSGYVKITMP